MPLKSLPLDEPGINLTSMLDVVMLLIIFFMLGTKFTEEERLYEIQLPTAGESSAMTDQPDAILVNVQADGAISMRAEAVTLAELEQKLTIAREQFPGQAVIVRADGRAVYQIVMDVMSAIRRAGIRNLSLANRPLEE